ncbi:nonstructural protein [Peromfec virus RodF8_53]|uniref:Nonstructural protein n=1 Tax=Peromfec virus RodF8_53 TaxID=2929382 RepID=A0A976N2B7_9VIRU|nr:nonstructural protein [Peromfec virus RodF8_53]
MKFSIFSVYDKVTGLYGNPFVALNEAVAKRSYAEYCANSYSGPDTQLYLLGEFDQVSGVIISCEKPAFVSGPILGGNYE